MRGIKMTTIKYPNILLFYILTSGTNFWFVGSNWIYFWTKYISYGFLGWVDGLAFAFSLFLEVPSGAIADIIGKKFTLLIAMFCGFIGTLLIATTTTSLQLTVGWFITQIAYSFYSGSAEALAYDSLPTINKEIIWEKVVTTAYTIESFSTALSTLIGGFLYYYWFRLPQFFWSFGFLIATIAAIFIVEPKKDSYKFSLNQYFTQIKEGTANLFKKEIKIYTFFIFSILGTYFLYSFGFIRPAIATSFGFYAREQSIIFSSLTFMGVLVVKMIPFIRSKLGDFYGLAVLSLLMSSGFFIASANVGTYGIFSILVIAISAKLATPWVSIIINKHINPNNRATTLSALTFIQKLPYVLIAVIAGNLIEKGMLTSFNFGVALTVLGITAIGVIYKLNLKS